VLGNEQSGLASLGSEHVGADEDGFTGGSMMMKREDLVIMALAAAKGQSMTPAQLDIAVFIVQEDFKGQIEGPLYEFHFPRTVKEAVEIAKLWDGQSY
jgi:hypothetical protein